MAEFCHPEFGCDCSQSEWTLRIEIGRLRDVLSRVTGDTDTELDALLEEYKATEGEGE